VARQGKGWLGKAMFGWQGKAWFCKGRRD
jgi:hypothetical protein